MSTVENVFDMDGDLEGADGHEGESGLEAALAASRRAEAKSAQVKLVAWHHGTFSKQVYYGAEGPTEYLAAVYLLCCLTGVVHTYTQVDV